MTNKESYKRYYTNNKEKVISTVRFQRRALFEWVESLKAEKSCCQCGENHVATLVFHHRNPLTKTDSISVLVKNGMSKETILSEIEKCDVFCCNCHAKLHYEERKLHKEKDVKYQEYLVACCICEKS